MALYFGSTEITSNHTVKFNGTDLTKIIFNNETVWEQQTEQDLGRNFDTRLASSTGTSYDLDTGSITVNHGTDTGVAIRKSFNSGSYTKLEVRVRANKNTYQDTGLVLTKNAWSWSKTNFNAYIKNGTSGNVVWKISDNNAYTTYTVDIEANTTYYLTLGGWSTSTAGANTTATVNSIKLVT